MVRRSIADAAHQLGKHPADLVLNLVEACESLDEIRPDIEDLHFEYYRLCCEDEPSVGARGSREQGTLQTSAQENGQSWSPGLLRVLRLLERHRHWGQNRAVKWKTLHRKYFQNGLGLKDIVDELIKRGLVGSLDQRSGSTYWLVEQHRTMILGLLKEEPRGEDSPRTSESPSLQKSLTTVAHKRRLQEAIAQLLVQ